MDLLRLEQQRQALEQNLQKLRASLRYWQTFEAEYEGLKEEINSDPSATDFNIVSKTYSGERVNEKEIRELAGLDTSSPRTDSAVIGLISRRQEYVQKNIETVQRQFWDAEAKLEELDFVASSSASQTNSGGLPLTEINEELDDDGNVVSSSLSRPGESTTKIFQSLKQAGFSDNDLVDSPGDSQDEYESPAPAETNNALPPALVDKRSRSSNDVTKTNETSGGGSGVNRPPVRKKSVSFSADTKPPVPVRHDSEDGKKSVSFNDKIAVMPAAPPPDPRSVSFSPTVEEIPMESPAPVAQAESSQAEDDIQKKLRGMFKPGEKVWELDGEENVAATHVVMPENESEEDARIRREMLDYHLNEVGHIVAEMNFLEGGGDQYNDEDESASEFAASEYLDEDTPYTSGLSESEDESEDEHGRNKRRIITDDYHKQMRDLESRLIGNLGPAPKREVIESIDPEINPADVHRLVIREKRGSQSSTSSDSDKKSSIKKRVSFAEDLDVADESSPPSKAIKCDDRENTAPVSDMVTERVVSTQPTFSQPELTGKPSWLKKGRADSAINQQVETMDVEYDPTPSGPAGKVIADTLLERDTAKTSASAPSEYDPIMQRRELAAEFYRRRNEIVRQQGGFKSPPHEDEDLGELMEERDGKLKKVSRFRAARIKPQIEPQ